LDHSTSTAFASLSHQLLHPLPPHQIEQALPQWSVFVWTSWQASWGLPSCYRARYPLYGQKEADPEIRVLSHLISSFIWITGSNIIRARSVPLTQPGRQPSKIGSLTSFVVFFSHKSIRSVCAIACFDIHPILPIPHCSATSQLHHRNPYGMLAIDPERSAMGHLSHRIKTKTQKHSTVTEKHTSIVIRGKKYAVAVSDMQGWRISKWSSRIPGAR